MNKGRKEAPGESLEQLARGFRGRTLVTAKLITSTGFKVMGKALGKARTSAADEAKSIEATTKLLEQLDQMKGLAMKFGQMASYLEGALPPAAQELLVKLQADSTPMSYRAVAEVIEQELGQPPRELFDEFDSEPFAAASIGQVHRALLQGSKLAVKVQYPDIAELFRSDLRTLGAFVQLSSLASPTPTKPLLVELQERVLEETDYVGEAAHQRLFRQLLSSIDNAAVPAVLEERSTRRVLTSELVEASPFYEFCERAPQDVKNRAAATIFEACFTCIFRHCIFNADPHPGNYLFGDDGEVTFLDFGCVKRFSAPFMDRWKGLARAVTYGDRKAFPEAVVEVGLAKPGRRFDWDYQWEMFQYLYEPFLASGSYTFTHDYVRRSYDMMGWDNPNKLAMRMPRDFLFINRLQWGLNSVLAHMNATGQWRDLWRRILDSPTEPAASPE